MKYINYILFFLIAVSHLSCETSEVENLFDNSPEERTNAKIKAVQDDLINSELGWYANYKFFVDNGTGDLSPIEAPFIFNFKEGNRVDIQSVYTEYEQKETNYNLKYAQQIDLVFDTYSVFSYLVDATKNADFRWELDSVGDNTYYFKSRATITEGITYLNLERADNESVDNFNEAKEIFAKNAAIQEIRTKLARNPEQVYFRNLKINSLDKGYAFEFNASTNTMSFKGVVDGSNDVLIFNTEVVINSDGRIELVDPFVIGNAEIREFTYDENLDELIITDSDGLEGKVVYDVQPAFTSVGLVNTFLNWDYSYAVQYSSALITLLNDVIRNDIEGFQVFQFYHQYGDNNYNSILIYSDPAPDQTNNWDGLDNVIRKAIGEDIILFDNTDAVYGFRGVQWFKEAYDANENLRTVYDDFLCDPEGLYLDLDIATNTMYLVSKRDPRLYIRLIEE